MRILSVNVGASRPVAIKDRTVQTGIYKIPATGPVAVTRLGLQDDVRIEVRKMGLEHSAVYAYPFEHYDYWQKELKREEAFPIGQFGENLTVTGLLEEEVRIGDIFRFGNTVLQVAHPRIPCNKLNARMGLRFAPMFLASRKVGYYMRVLTEGTVEQDGTIELLERDESSPTMEEFVRIAHYEYWDEVGLQYLLQARDLVPTWQEMLEAKLKRAQTTSGWHGAREFEVVRREQESENTVSLYLKCIRDRALAPFRAGQQLMVVLGGHSANQQRQPHFLSSSPADLSSYRITLRHTPKVDPDQADDSVASHLFSLQLGEHILCNAPFGQHRPAPEETSEDRISVLVSQGLGITPMLTHLYELEGKRDHVFVFHEPAAQDPQGLLGEAARLVENNPGFKMFYTGTDEADQISAKMIRDYVPLILADIHVAGSSSFVERLVNEFMALDFSPAALIVHNID